MTDTIRVAVGVTRNLGNFNSLRLDTDYTTEQLKGETPEQAFARAWALVEKELEDKAAEYEEE
jgi:hypothetical protein